MRTPVTMRDVAARAGVTPTVVSRVLHNKATSIRVSEATAVRVREAAKDLGYRVNVFARNFRERQTNMIGVLHGVGFVRPVLSEGPRYFACLMDGIIEGAFASGYSVTLCPKLMGQTPEDAMSDGRFDGLVWYSTVPSEENAQMLLNCRSPLVVVHAPFPAIADRFPVVSCDNEGGMALALQHLADLGHRRIAYAWQGEREFTESRLRRDVFLAWMRDRGLPAGEADVIECPIGSDAVAAYLAASPRHTAVIAHNETLAGEFVWRAPEHGVRVPDDLSVVGFDSTAFCDELRPRLTAISQPLQEIGRQAAELLVARIADDTLPPQRVVLPCGLDVRESTGKASSTRR